MFSKLTTKNKILVILIFFITILFFSLALSFGTKAIFDQSSQKKISAEAEEIHSEEKLDDEKKEKEEDPPEEVEEIKPITKTESDKEKIPEVISDPLVPSSYKIGIDISEGIYKLESIDNNSSYYKITCKSEDNYEFIVEEELFSYFTYIQVSSGQTLYLVDADITSMDSAKPFSGSNFVDGKYIVGFDIPEGSYKVTSRGDVGSISISTSAKQSDTIFQQYISNEVTINLKKGQYLMTSMVNLDKF